MCCIHLSTPIHGGAKLVSCPGRHLTSTRPLPYGSLNGAEEKQQVKITFCLFLCLKLSNSNKRLLLWLLEGVAFKLQFMYTVFRTGLIIGQTDQMPGTSRLNTKHSFAGFSCF